MDVRSAHTQHPRDAGTTEVDIQDANLRTTKFYKCLFTFEKGHGQMFDLQLLTFFPACLKARANSVVMVLFPTPPFPDSTRTTCFTSARLPSHMKRKNIFKSSKFTYFTSDQCQNIRRIKLIINECVNYLCQIKSCMLRLFKVLQTIRMNHIYIDVSNNIKLLRKSLKCTQKQVLIMS